MTPRTIEFLDLVFRWVHVIAAIMWVGNSLLFNWLDRNLRPSTRGGEAMQGEAWLIHSGGFYFVEKTLLAGQPLPRPLHWFKWQAYITWLSGACLLLVVYYVGGRALLVDPAVAALSPATATGIAIGTIAAGWLLYELLWRVVAPRSGVAAGVLSIAALIAAVLALTSLLSGRAAYLHVGALLGTIMAGNVAMTIMPSQRVLVRSVEGGGGADAAIAEQAKTRSIHNNYLAFPVIALMLSAHFPSLYGHARNWLPLLIIVASGAAVRHIMNARFTWRPWVPALAGTVGVSLLALYLAVERGGGRGVHAAALGGLPSGGSVTFAEARTILDRRCATCHSLEPADDSFGVAPGGVAFDSPLQMRALAERIRERAVVTHTMPPANQTRITERERAVLGRWVEQGAPIE